ncbi:hypothetical protein CKO15_05975 [Halorhodospira abdelmalekii]|uniref:hypothetical protein n=1 Tax=Halorhodospira abdelmalekii TaxID=421629 RepID=UPI00190767AC|nr:hypothetical protein [Halorhodospira abdelmalekii]MBK1734843.1 hypothetical protein [Halorhodospira abdelmalekii]
MGRRCLTILIALAGGCILATPAAAERVYYQHNLYGGFDAGKWYLQADEETVYDAYSIAAVIGMVRRQTPVVRVEARIATGRSDEVAGTEAKLDWTHTTLVGLSLYHGADCHFDIMGGVSSYSIDWQQGNGKQTEIDLAYGAELGIRTGSSTLVTLSALCYSGTENCFSSSNERLYSVNLGVRWLFGPEFLSGGIERARREAEEWRRQR